MRKYRHSVSGNTLSEDIRWPVLKKCGYSNSKGNVDENAYFILTPTDQVAREKVEAYEKICRKPESTPGYP